MDLMVVCLGRIGLVAACCLAESGHNVTGIEVDQEKLAIIRSGGCPFYEPGIGELLKSLASAGRSIFAWNVPDHATAQAVMVGVNSPSSADGSTDLSEVQKWLTK